MAFLSKPTALGLSVSFNAASKLGLIPITVTSSSPP